MRPSLPDAATRGTDVVSTISLVAANLVPLAGVIFFGWDAAALLLLYWAENLVIGFYTLLRIALASVGTASSGAHLAKLFLIPFFCVHFGAFCAVHGIFVQGFFYPDAKFDGLALPGPLIIVGWGVSVVRNLAGNLPTGALLALASLFISHGTSFVENYLLRGEYRTADPGAQMARPYGRVVVLHVTIIVGAFAVMLLGTPVALVAVLVIIKLCMDLHLHRRSHGSGGHGAGKEDDAQQPET